MNLKKVFLSLSIKHQISFVISIISILCLALILALFSLYGNIIISIRSRARQEYFNERYKLCFDSLIDLQNFLLYQYEQFLAGFNEQLYYFGISLNDFNETFFEDKILPFKIVDYIDNNNEEESDITTIKQYYKFNFSKSDDTCDISDINTDFTKNKVFLHNHLNNIKNLKVSYLGIGNEDHYIYEDFIIVSFICKFLLADKPFKINEIKDISNNNVEEHLEEKINEHIKYIEMIFEEYKNGNFKLMDILYPDLIILLLLTI